MSEKKSPLVVPSPPRRWYQRRLYLLLIFLTFCAIPYIGLIVKMRREPATMTFDLRTETYGPPGSFFEGEVRVHAREGDRLTGHYYDFWSDDEERRKADFHCLATDNEVVVVRRGEALEAHTNSVCGGAYYILHISDRSTSR